VAIFVFWAISKEWNFIWSSWTSCRTQWNFLMIIYAVFHLFKYEVVHKVKGVNDQTWAQLYVLTLLTLFEVKDTDGWMWPCCVLTLNTLCRQHIRTQLFSYNTHLADCDDRLQKSHTMKHSCETVTSDKLANHTRF